MQMVVLDGYTLNPGDLSWQPLEDLGHCTVYDRTLTELVVPRAAEAEILLTNKTKISRHTIRELDRLQYVGVLATGHDIVDLDAAHQRGIVVTNVPSYGTASVVQMVFAHLLNLTVHLGDHANGVRGGRWCQSPDWCYWDSPLVEISGLTLGIVGFGRIGRATAAVAKAFGMKVLACDAERPTHAPSDVEWTDLEDLLRRSDVVSLHCPLTAATRHMIDRRRLTLMKPTALLINTSRGPLVDEDALAEALGSGHIAGAGLDVLSVEPPPCDNPLLTAATCCITPHIAWATRAARQRLLTVAAENVRSYLAGRPQNVV